MKETVVIFVDYESPTAYRVARDVWTALSRTALNSGLAGITARWKGLREEIGPSSYKDSSACLYIIGQDRPEMAEFIEYPGTPKVPRLYGVVVATPERPSPLSGALLYQGVERLTGDGVKAGAVLPALVPVSPKTEGEAYAARFLDRMQRLQTTR